MLSLDGVKAGYGSARVLHDISLTVAEGKIAGFLGRNGMGKTTTIKSIMGFLPLLSGQITFAGTDLAGLRPEQIARLGIGLVPEGRQIFPTLSVRENLVATARPGPWTIERLFALFPRLKERANHPGGRLSGGEQQMLAIGRALMTNPRLLIMDELTEGLAPRISEEIWRTLGSIKTEGLAILIVDKNVHALSRFADELFFIEKGVTVYRGSPEDLRRDPPVAARYLGLDAIR